MSAQSAHSKSHDFRVGSPVYIPFSYCGTCIYSPHEPEPPAYVIYLINRHKVMTVIDQFTMVTNCCQEHLKCQL